MHTDLGHMVVSSIVHGLVYDVIFKATRHLTVLQTVIVAAVVIAAVWIGTRFFGRRR